MLTGLVAVAVVLVDQITKTLAVDHLSNGPVHLLGPLSFALSYNTGIAFSVATGLTLPIIVVVVCVVGLVVWLGRGLPSIPGSVAIGLVLGGALGNLGDRLFRGRGGAVVDFVSTRYWPTFNVADSCIVIGSVMLAVVFWRHAPHIASSRHEGEGP